MVDVHLKEGLLNITKLIFFTMYLITYKTARTAKYRIARRIISPLLIFVNILLILNKIADTPLGDLFDFCIGIVTFVAVSNVFSKVVTISYFEEEIEDLFNWIRRFYFDNSASIVADVKNKYLARTLPFLRNYIKICIAFVTGFFVYAVISYTVNGILVIKVPYWSKQATVHLQQGIYFSYIAFYGIPILCFTCTGFIFIGILRLFNECITKLEDAAESENESLFVLHKLHLEIYEKFHIYEEIFSFSLFFEMTLHGGAMILLLLTLHLYPNYILFYYSFYVMSSQVFIYCCFGQFIFSETEKIPVSLYLTKWYDMNPSTQKTLLLMLTMASRPFGLKAGGMYDMNFMLFIDIMKICFTYYAIISALL